MIISVINDFACETKIPHIVVLLNFVPIYEALKPVLATEVDEYKTGISV